MDRPIALRLINPVTFPAKTHRTIVSINTQSGGRWGLEF
jgi:hypothetical protein